MSTQRNTTPPRRKVRRRRPAKLSYSKYISREADFFCEEKGGSGRKLTMMPLWPNWREPFVTDGGMFETSDWGEGSTMDIYG